MNQFLKQIFYTLPACFILLAVSAAYADSSITPGSTISVTVYGNQSIYQVFGHSGSSLNDAANSLLVTFAAGPNNAFNFNATGSISNCCTFRGPDGAILTSTITFLGINGLSNSVGNSALPLLGVFLSNADPYGQTAPAALVYDANNPTSLAPVLGQVFYIGDGLSGFNNSNGSALTFTAPATANRLYLGIADGYNNQIPTKYGDNSGSFSVQITQAGSAAPAQTTVPLPEGFMVLLFGCLSLLSVLAVRRRKLDLE